MSALLCFAVRLRCKDFHLIMEIFGEFDGFIGLGLWRFGEMWGCVI